MSDWKDSWINAPMSVAVTSILLNLVSNYFIKKEIKEIKKEIKINKNNNKGNNTNSPQTNSGDGSITIIDNRTYNNTYNNSPNKDTIISLNSVIKNEKKEQKEELEKETGEQKKAESKDEPTEKGQEMSQQEFENLLIKVKFIAFGIMGNIKWEKVKPLDFWKEEGKEFAQLVFEVENKTCSIYYEISEEDKQRFLKTNTSEIVERFITLRLIHYGKNGYFDYHCPDCKQTTLTKSSIINDPGKEAICCVLCRWAVSMEVYLEYFNDKRHNSSLEFSEWLRERNRRMARTRREKT